MTTSIVLASEDIDGEPGYQIHGVFPTMQAAARHVGKDSDMKTIEIAQLMTDWERPVTHNVIIGNCRWTAAVTPNRDERGL